MKRDKIFYITEIAKWVFFLGIPLILFFAKCTTIFGKQGGASFIIGCSGYIAGLILYLCAKRFMFKSYFTNLNTKMVNYITALESETDTEKITLIENALQKTRMIRDSFTVIPTLLILALVLTLIKAMESGLITLFSVVGLSFLSFILGFISMLIQDWNIKSKNRGN